MYLAIDPGIDTGWAAFDESGKLYLCSVGDPQASAPHVIIERPQVYRAANSKGDPNDLITLAIQVGRYVERMESRGAKVALALPTTWKGQVPKDIHNARVLAALSKDERTLFDAMSKGIAKSKVHNMTDAIGLGKWAFKWKAWL